MCSNEAKPIRAFCRACEGITDFGAKKTHHLSFPLCSPSLNALGAEKRGTMGYN